MAIQRGNKHPVNILLIKDRENPKTAGIDNRRRVQVQANSQEKEVKVERKVVPYDSKSELPLEFDI